MICSIILFSLIVMQGTSAWERPVVSVNVVLDDGTLRTVLRNNGEDPASFESEASEKVAELFQTTFPYLELSTTKDAAWHLRLTLAPACETNDQRVDIELELSITGPEDVYRAARPWCLFRSFMPLRKKTVDSLVNTVTNTIRKQLQLKELRPVAFVLSLIPVAWEGTYDSRQSTLVVGLREEETGLSSVDTEFQVRLNYQPGLEFLRVVAIGTHGCGKTCPAPDCGFDNCFSTHCMVRDLKTLMSKNPDVDTVFVTLPVLSSKRVPRMERSHK